MGYIYKIDKEALKIVYEYVIYIYEEEKTRRDILNDTTRIYLAAFGLVAAVGIIKMETIDMLAKSLRNLFNVSALLSIVLLILMLGSTVLFVISFFFTISAVKMWKRERLCDPQDFLYRVSKDSSEEVLLSAIIADYAVTTRRNHDVNERKARLLSMGLTLFVLSIGIFGSAIGLLGVVYVIT